MNRVYSEAKPNNSNIQRVAAEYFGFLGSHLPYQCTSDEFYFLPRSEKAVEHLGTLDDLRPEKIQHLVRHVNSLIAALPTEGSSILEEEIDRVTLKKSMERFIREFGSAATWRQDPTLYIKVALFAVDQVLSQGTPAGEEPRQALTTVLRQIPRFLAQGLDNLERPSVLSVAVAVEMAHDAFNFFRRDVERFIQEILAGDSRLLQENQKALAGWDAYRKGLEGLKTVPSFSIGETAFTQMFAISVDSAKSPAEALEIAEDRFQTTLKTILMLADSIDPGTAWQDMARNAGYSAESSGDILELYRQEVEALRAFFHARDLLTFPVEEKVQVLPTPVYLQSLRATASYKAPLTGRPAGAGVFYVTPGSELSGLILSHKPYLSAHETYPGHHVLDAIRLHHPNPVRRQIEAPLFYEGWACYAETLLDEFGYTMTPRQRLVQLQRQLWRDLRTVLDVKLQTGRITIEEGAKEIEKVGFPSAVAARQIRRFALTPGYQSCYFLGMEEILRLRDRYAGRLGLKGFHDRLLEGGQLSFDLVEKRLEAAAAG